MRAPNPVTDLRFAVTPDHRRDGSTVDLSWSGGEGARSFLIDVGSSRGSADIAAFDSRTPQPSFRWTAAPVGQLYIRVRGRNEFGTADASPEVRVDSVDPRHVIEALFLGSGPLAARREAPCDRPSRPSWPLDTPVVLRVGRDVPEAMTRGLEALRGQVPGATRGALWLTIVREDEYDLRPRPGELTLSLTDEVFEEVPCPLQAAGCAVETIAGTVLESVRLMVRREHESDVGLLARELAHSVFGLHHVEAPLGLRPRPLLDAGGPSPTDAANEAAPWDATTVRAVKAVYGAGLSAGASRHRFFAAGLIDSPASVIPRHESSKVAAPSRTRWVRPLCGLAADLVRRIAAAEHNENALAASTSVP